MAIKKSELYSSLWKGYDELRGGMDASQGFLKDGSKNRLRAQDMHKIVDAFNNQVEITGYSRLVPLAEIEANEYNLNLPHCLDTSEPEDVQDLSAYLLGGLLERDLRA